VQSYQSPLYSVLHGRYSFSLSHDHVGQLNPCLSTHQDFEYIVWLHCTDRVAIHFIERGDYETICAEDSQIVDLFDLVNAVKSARDECCVAANNCEREEAPQMWTHEFGYLLQSRLD
jgi:hypothetical protein